MISVSKIGLSLAIALVVVGGTAMAEPPHEHAVEYGVFA